MNRLRTQLFWRRMIRLQLGLFLFGFAVSLMLEAQIGLDPWSSLHESVGQHLGLTFGQVTQGIGLVLIVVGVVFLGVRPGVGTVSNMLVVGPWVDILRIQEWFPHFGGGVQGTLQLLSAILVMGIATAIYIGARLGAGPRDGFVMGLSQRIKKSLRATRIGIEVIVLGTAVTLGGPIGLGTVLFASLMGPTMQASLKLFRVDHDPSPEWDEVATSPPSSLHAKAARTS